MLKIEIKTGGAAFMNENDEFDAYFGGKEYYTAGAGVCSTNI